MHNRSAIVTALLSLVCIAQFRPVSAEPYVSIVGYQIEPPTGWTVTPDAHNGVIIKGPLHHKPAPSIQVTVMTLTSPVNGDLINAAVDDFIKGEQTMPSFHLVNRELTVIAGEPSASFVVTGRATPKGPTVRLWQLFVPHGSRAFLITLGCAPSEVDAIRPTLKAAVESFSFGNSNGQRYVSNKYRYSFLPVGNWTLKPNEDGSNVKVVEQDTRGFAANLGIRVKAAPTSGDSAEWLNSERDKMNREMSSGPSGFRLLSQGFTTIVGAQALDATFSLSATMPDNTNLPVQMHMIVIAHGHFIYRMTFMGLTARASEQDAQFMRMMNSLEWTTDQP